MIADQRLSNLLMIDQVPGLRGGQTFSDTLRKPRFIVQETLNGCIQNVGGRLSVLLGVVGQCGHTLRAESLM